MYFVFSGYKNQSESKYEFTQETLSNQGYHSVSGILDFRARFAIPEECQKSPCT